MCTVWQSCSVLLPLQFMSLITDANTQQCCIQLFRERLLEKICTQQSRKVIWDMSNTPFLTPQLSNILLLLSFTTRKHMTMASRAILSNLFEEQ